MGKRSVTLCTIQWADLPFEDLCKLAAEMGYDGLELAVWGFDLDRAYVDDEYVEYLLSTAREYHLTIQSLATHIVGQCVGDLPDPRLNNFAPAELADQPEAIRDWAIETMKKSAVVAKKLGSTCNFWIYRLTNLALCVFFPTNNRKDD